MARLSLPPFAFMKKKTMMMVRFGAVVSAFVVSALLLGCSSSAPEETTSSQGSELQGPVAVAEAVAVAVSSCMPSAAEQGFKHHLCVPRGEDESSDCTREAQKIDGQYGDTLTGCTDESTCPEGKAACWYTTREQTTGIVIASGAERLSP